MVPVLVVALLSAGGPWGPAGLPDGESLADPVCVVAHLPPGLGPGAVELELVRRLFLARQGSWPDGTPAHPVNLPAASPIRDQFSREVLGQGVRELAAYWNDRYFHGTRPPPTVASTEAVRLFLAGTAGGVGYLPEPETLSLPAGVQRLFCVPAPP